MIKGAIFDVDGVILDSMPIWTNAGERYLLTHRIAAEKHLGKKLFEMTLFEGAKYLQTTYLSHISVEKIQRGILRQIEAYYFETPTLKNGAVELLESFRQQKIPVVVATSTDRYLIEKSFQTLHIRQYFRRIFTCTEVGKGKSHPDIFLQALEELKTTPQETVLFEDGLYSVKTAKKMGLKIVGVYDQQSQHNQKELERCSDYYCHSLTEFAADRGHHFLSL